MADTDLKFVHEDSDLIIAELKADLEASLGRTIAPADIEMLLINAFAYRETLLRTGVNEAARQNMVSFSRGAALEYLGQLVGVTRQPAAGAMCTLNFVLVAGHNGVTIPAGLRVQSMDGKVIFQTIEDTVCAVGTLEASVAANASTAGVIGNGYEPNTITIILDPKAYISSAQNTDITGGGADEETDERLRERITLAPASFSVAGPDDAYRFFAKSAHPSIVDVAITSPNPGEVLISPLLEGGNMPTEEILDAVEAICNSKKVRPLTDTVNTAEPSKVDYEIEVNLTLLTTAVSASIQAAVQKILADYKEERKNRLGVDVVRSKLVAISKIDGVYDVDIVSPLANIEAADEVYTNCTSITVNVIGTHDE
jgi:phage-related baseplate assembly protein